MRLPHLLSGPHAALPRPLDALSDRWASLRPRVRVLIAVATLLMVAAGLHLRVQAAESRWGGTPVSVLVADDDLAVGAPAEGARRVTRPPEAVPPAAVAEAPEGAVLALAAPEGAVLTEAHLAARGPAAGLEADLRAVPVPVEDAWAVTAGGWVDVWVLGTGAEPATLVASARPVLELREDGTGATALVGLHRDDEVGPVTAGLAMGKVLLAHAPPPSSSPEALR